MSRIALQRPPTPPLVLCQTPADGWYSLGMVSWKTKTPGGCHAEALSCDVDRFRAGGVAKSGEGGKGGRAETDPSKNPAVGRSGRRRPGQVRSRNCRGVGLWARERRANA